MKRRTLGYQKTLLSLVLADLLWAVGAYVGAFFLRIHFPFPFTDTLLPSGRPAEVNHSLFFLLCMQVVVLYFFGLYDLYALRRHVRLVTNVAAALGIQLLATTAWYFFQGDFFFPRSVLVLFWFLNVVGVAGLRWVVVHRLRQVSPLRVLLVGATEEVRTFLADLTELLHVPELTIAGLVSVNGKPDTQDGANLPWLGSADDLPRIMQEVEVDEVIVLSPPTWKDSFVARLLRSPDGRQVQQGERPRVLVVPSVYDILVGRVSSLRLHDVPLVEVLKNPQEDIAFLVKGLVDVLIAVLLLILSLPILLVAAVLIKLTSSGPVLYRQQRIGERGREFTIYKLRTMVDGAEEKTGPVLASPEDERVTRVGRFLRAGRIDEIPQLLNVLNGTMSLVGPR
ncbi:MAG: sugar transferase, partial [Candidatus Binatia bacterium]